MVFFKPLPEISAFVSRISNAVNKDGSPGLSSKQAYFIAITITAMVLLGQLCWYAMARALLNHYTAQALSFMLHHSKIPWSKLLQAAVSMLLQTFSITEVHLVLDDTPRTRCKIVRKLFGVFKTIDKKTGGFCLSQNLVFIVVVTSKITFPIGFTFYRPDPRQSRWRANDKALMKKGVAKKDRPRAPQKKRQYPTRITIAENLIRRAQKFLSGVRVTINGKDHSVRVISVLADAAYLTKSLSRTVRHLFPKAQCISQVRKNQICWNKSGVPKSIHSYFESKTSICDRIRLRGGEEKSITYCSARLFIKSHGEMLHIIALKYDDEAEYRYLAATELTWRALDIIRAYALRWLVEVVIEDWKQYDGFGRKACQQGADGACRGVILSLLVDCFLLLHPYQLRLYQAGKPLCTAGSLVRTLQFESLVNCIKDIVESPDPKARLEEFSKVLPNIVVLRASSKHMNGRELGIFEASPHMAHRKRQAA